MSRRKYRPGDHVVTSGNYAVITGMCHEGELIAPQPWRDGLWTMRAHHPVLGRRPQLVHESMFELHTEEHVGRPAGKTLKMSGHAWQPTDRDNWTCAEIEARIRRLDDRTYSVIRGRKYLGSEKTLELAAERAELNRLSDANLAGVPSSPPVDRGVAARERVRAEVSTRRKAEPRAGKSGERNAEILTLLARGCTREEVLRVTGWKAVSMQQMARSLGVGLRVETGSKPYKYYSASVEVK